jgi:hypothetical protein
MKRVVPLLLLTALAACTDRDVVQPAQHTAVRPRTTLTPTGPLPATRQFWKDTSTLWVYNSQPELGVNAADGSPATNSFIASQNMRFVRVELPWDSTMEDAPYQYTLPEGAKGVQLVELALQSWKERRWIDVEALEI